MKVYAVIGGWHYGGEHFESLRLFDCKSAAEKYQEFLTERTGMIMLSAAFVRCAWNLPL